MARATNIVRSIEPFGRNRIGARHDQRFDAASRIQRCLDLADHLGRGDQGLAVEVPAALRRDLILDLDGVGAGALEQPHRAHHVERVAEASISIGDDRKLDALADGGQRFHHFGDGD